MFIVGFLSIFSSCEIITEGNLYFTKLSDNAVSVQGSPSSKDSNSLVNQEVNEVIIPKYIKNKYKVVIIGVLAFRNNNNIQKIFISNTVEEIQNDALAHMQSLTEVIVEEHSSLTRLMRGFLYNTTVSTFVIPSTVSYTDIYVFGATNMEYVKYCGPHIFTQSTLFKSDTGSYKPPKNVYVSNNYLYTTFGPVQTLTYTNDCDYINQNIYHQTCNKLISFNIFRKFLFTSISEYFLPLS